MNTRLIPIAAAVAALLAGCAVGPDYKRPASTLPAAYEEAAPEAATPVVAEWWRSFNDPQLDALVDRAMKDSADVRIAIARIEQADAVLRQAGAALLPELDISGSANRSQSSALTATSPTADLQRNSFRLTGVMTSYELDFWGRFRRAREAALAQAAGSHYARDTVRLTLASDISTTYIALRSVEAQRDASIASLKTRDEALAIAQRRYAAGSVSALDVNQAQSNRALLAVQLSALVQQRETLYHQLAALVGDPALVLAPGADVSSLPTPPSPPAGLPSSLLDARPDVRQAEATLKSYNAQIGVAKAAMFPTISLTGFFGGESADLSKLFNSGARIWSATAALNLPVFDAGRRLAQVDQASAQQKEAFEQYRKTAENAYREVRDALVAVRQGAESEQARQAQLVAARNVERIARARYEAGSAAFLELLDAQRSSNDAQVGFLQARQARLAASVSLYKALGGGWKPDVALQ